jgi:hypothetical protein
LPIEGKGGGKSYLRLFKSAIGNRKSAMSLTCSRLRPRTQRQSHCLRRLDLRLTTMRLPLMPDHFPVIPAVAPVDRAPQQVCAMQFGAG